MAATIQRHRSGVAAARAFRQERETRRAEIFGAVTFGVALLIVVLVFWGLGAIVPGAR